MQRPDPQHPALRARRDLAYTYAAIAGLLAMALHTMGLGVLDPGKVLNGDSLARSLPEVWPYLILCAGVAAHRRWARDLASPVAFTALVAALAVLPRYEFLNLEAARDPRFVGRAVAVWHLFKRQLAVQGMQALLCGGAFYALTRTELIRSCAQRQRQPDWTVGLSFAGALLLGWEFFAASQALDNALYGLGAWRAGFTDWRGLGLALLALAALVGLWKRRWWGWLAAGVQALILASRLLERALTTASSGFYAVQAKAPLAAPFLAGEAFCRFLPELSVLACALAAFAVSLDSFRPARPAVPASAGAAAPNGRPKTLKDYEPW